MGGWSNRLNKFLVFTWRHQFPIFKTRRPTEILPSSKERFRKNIYLHNSFARYRAFFWQQNNFNFRNFIVRDIRRTAVPELFRTSEWLPAIFSILNNASLRRNICLNFRKLTRENKPLFWQTWTPDVFFLFPAAMLVSLRRAPAWRLHTKLYKFVWNIMSNNSNTENRTDLRLGQSPYLFIVYNVSISWLHSLNGFLFLFWWRDSENRQYKWW